MKYNRYTNLLSFPLLTLCLLTPSMAMADATEIISTHFPWRGVTSRATAISDSRQFVLFDSEARNLVTEDLNDLNDVFLRDRNTATTSIVSRSRTGGPTDGRSTADDMTANGRYVLYTTTDSSWSGDFYKALVLLDRTTGISKQVNLDESGNPVRGYGDVLIILLSATSDLYSYDFGSFSAYGKNARISVDGRLVVFSVRDTIYVRDTVFNTTSTISVPDQLIELSAISPDARFIVYRQGQRIDHTLYVHDRHTGLTRQVDVGRYGEAPNGQVFREAGISTDGRYVTFASKASNLVADDDNPGWDVFVRDMQLGYTSRISQANLDDSVLPSITSDGRFVTFVSTSKLVMDDNNGTADIYRYDMNTGGFERISVNHQGEDLTTTIGWEINSVGWGYGVSHRGDSIVFAGGWDFINPYLVYARDLCQNPNSTPVASIDLPASIVANDTWNRMDQLNGGDSSDADSDRLDYHWIWPALDYPVEYSPPLLNYNTEFYWGYVAKSIPVYLPVGRHVFGLRVDDRCGGTDTTYREINVNFNFDGYSSPVKPGASFKIGQKVNIRFGFRYADGRFADDANVLLTVSERYSGPLGWRTVWEVDGGFGRNGDRFDYAWDTSGMLPGSYRINVNPRDGIGDGASDYYPYVYNDRSVEIYLY